MSGLNSMYIASLDLNPYQVSNQNAEALAGGKIWFYVDNNRTVAKNIFELVQGSGSPPNYTYAPLPNPITLSNSGTFMDANGNDVSVYYYPFDQFGNLQLYYVVCYDAFGNLQFTREAWPYPFGASGGGTTTSTAIGANNQITNPQFAQVLFNPSLGISNTYSGSATTTINFAPDWALAFTHTGAGTITLNQTAVAGVSAYPFNPPYVLTVNAGTNITSLTLVQTLSQNTDWASPQIAGVNGYLASSILLGPNTNAQMQYVSSAGNPIQTLLSANNATGTYVQYYNTVELDPAANPNTPPTAYDQIVVNLLNTSGVSVIGNVQVIPLTTNISLNQFDQTTVNRQIDQSFNYYNPLLQYKPIPSYLVGWDFPLNPAQPLGASIAAQTIATNSSYYAWDQTILYQSANTAITVSRGSNGELVLTAAATTQMAVIQYLTGQQVNEILNGRLSVNVEAKTNNSSGYQATVSLWYGTGTLPSCIGSNLSIVGMLNSTGYPVSFNQPTGGGAVNWAPVPRSGLGLVTGTTGGSDAQFTIKTSATTNFNQYRFSGWDLQGASTTQSATLFAMVLGTASITSGDSISINSISLVPGDIPTRPAPKTPAQALIDCQYYYESSFALGTVPAQNVGTNTGEWLWQTTPSLMDDYNYSNLIPFKVTKYAIPHSSTGTVTTYNPAAANAQVRNETTGADLASTTVYQYSQDGIVIRCTVSGGNSGGAIFGVHWSADVRLAQ